MFQLGRVTTSRICCLRARASDQARPHDESCVAPCPCRGTSRYVRLTIHEVMLGISYTRLLLHFHLHFHFSPLITFQSTLLRSNLFLVFVSSCINFLVSSWPCLTGGSYTEPELSAQLNGAASPAWIALLNDVIADTNPATAKKSETTIMMTLSVAKAHQRLPRSAGVVVRRVSQIHMYAGRVLSVSIMPESP